MTGARARSRGQLRHALRRFAMQQLAWRQQRAPTVRVDDPPPGQEAQVDFGKMGPMLDPVAGRVRMLWALIVTLSFSRYQFVWPTFVQTTETVCEGLDGAWMFFAAMIHTIVPDNMKAIVKTPDALTPILVAAFLDYRAGARLLRGPGTHSLSQGQASASKTRCPSCARALVRRRDFHGPRRRTPQRRDVVPRHRRRTRARHHLRRSPGGVRVDGEASGRCRRRPPHHSTCRSGSRRLRCIPTITFRSHAPSTRCPRSIATRCVRARADKTCVKIYLGTELIKMRIRVNGRADARPTRATIRVRKADYALRSVDGAEGSRAQQGDPRRHLCRASTRRSSAVGADARRVRALAPLRQVRRRPRRSGLPRCALFLALRCHRRTRASRACSRLAAVSRCRPNATTARSCSSHRRVSRDPSNTSRLAPPTRRRASDGSLRPRDPSRARHGAQAPEARTHPRHASPSDFGARGQTGAMSFDDLLLLVLTDEIARRDSAAADHRAARRRDSIRRCASSSGTRRRR